MELLVDGLLPKGASASILSAAGDEGQLKGAVALSRSKLEAPEVDGVVYIQGRSAAKLKPGMFVQGEIVKAMDYDLMAKYAAQEDQKN